MTYKWASAVIRVGGVETPEWLKRVGISVAGATAGALVGYIVGKKYGALIGSLVGATAGALSKYAMERLGGG